MKQTQGCGHGGDGAAEDRERVTLRPLIPYPWHSGARSGGYKMLAISMDARMSPDHHPLLALPQDFPAGPVKVTIESVRAEVEAPAPQQSALGRRLQALRWQALAEGMTTLTQDDVLAEVRRWRGEPVQDGQPSSVGD